MAESSRWGELAVAIGMTQLRSAVPDATVDELGLAGSAVRQGLDALPDVVGLGVHAVTSAVSLPLAVFAGGHFQRATPDRQAAALGRVVRWGLPGAAELVRMTGGLALVAVTNARSTAAGPS